MCSSAFKFHFDVFALWISGEWIPQNIEWISKRMTKYTKLEKSEKSVKNDYRKTTKSIWIIVANRKSNRCQTYAFRTRRRSNSCCLSMYLLLYSCHSFFFFLCSLRSPTMEWIWPCLCNNTNHKLIQNLFVISCSLHFSFALAQSSIISLFVCLHRFVSFNANVKFNWSFSSYFLLLRFQLTRYS